MDPLSVSAVVGVLSKVVGGATGEAGKRLWGSLAELVRGVFTDQDAAEEAVRQAEENPDDPTTVQALAEVLVSGANNDPDAAARLREWLSDAERAASSDHSVTNTISGDVSGKAVQARDVHGDISL